MIRAGDKVRIKGVTGYVWRVLSIRDGDKVDMVCLENGSGCGWSVGDKTWDHLRNMTKVDGDEEFKIGDVVTYKGGTKYWTIVSEKQASKKAFNIVDKNGAEGIVYADDIVKANSSAVAEKKTPNCECGSGSDLRGRMHSTWCRCYEA